MDRVSLKPSKLRFSDFAAVAIRVELTENEEESGEVEESAKDAPVISLQFSFSEPIESFFDRIENSPSCEFLSEEECQVVLGTTYMFHYLSVNSRSLSEGMGEYVESATIEVDRMYRSNPEMQSIIPYKIFVDSNLFNERELLIVKGLKKRCQHLIPNLSKGWPIIEYASDVFQGLPGEIPISSVIQKLSIDFFEFGWKLIEKGALLETDVDFGRFVRCLSTSACYCGRIKKIEQAFPEVYQEVLFQRFS